MHTYLHKVNYYETDKMGITHHSEKAVSSAGQPPAFAGRRGTGAVK